MTHFCACALPNEKSSFQNDFDYTTQMNRCFLKPIGIWPKLPCGKIIEKCIICVQIFFCYCLICFRLVPCGLHTFLIEKDPALRLKMIGPMSFCLMAITKFSFLVYHRSDIYDCLKHIAIDWSNVRSSREREIMLTDAKFGRFVASLCAGFMYSGGFFYHTIMPFSSELIVMPDNTTLKPLTHPVYDRFFNAQTSPTYEIVFLTQWFSGFVMYTVTIGACSIAAIFALHASGQFKVLVDRLDKLVDGDDERCDSIDDRMTDIVQLHLRSLRRVIMFCLVRRLEEILNEICFVEFIGCTMNICFLGYYFMTVKNNRESLSNKSVNSTTNEPNRDTIVSSMNDLLSPSNDFKNATQVNRYSLKLLGIWPQSNVSAAANKFKTDGQICCYYFGMSFLLIPCGLHTFLVEEDPVLQVKMFGPMSFFLMGITKLSFLVFHRNSIHICLEHIATDWSEVRSSKEREIMVKDAKFGHFVASLCAGFMYGGGLFYHTIMPLSTGIVVLPDNTTLRPLMYPIYHKFFTAQSSPTYEIVFAIQLISGLAAWTILVGACSIAAVFALHVCGQFNVIIDRLNKLVDGNDEKFDTVDDRLAAIVELHLRSLRLINRLEEILNGICFVELVGCTMTICFVGYYIITEWEHSKVINTLTYCILLVSFTFNIFILCYIGEMLANQGERVGAMAYMIEWYRLQSIKARGLILILVISKNPARITAGKMAELSMRNFCNVLKTALTYLSLLRTFVV